MEEELYDDKSVPSPYINQDGTTNWDKINKHYKDTYCGGMMEREEIITFIEGLEYYLKCMQEDLDRVKKEISKM
ncbi:MAG: hypothetical protein IMZ52_04670 [Actinobacteria bacterium]|nr:hypothetical protein [Actinomycetota bacterium]MBE3114758.1 hypothetical protein [Actinomycetota bacterium]